MEKRNDNPLTFEEWEALYNAMSALETVVLSSDSCPPAWEDIVKDGFLALAKLEIPMVPLPEEFIREKPLRPESPNSRRQEI